MKIYTRTGDAGSTGLFGGARVPKNDLRIATCGDIDELNSCLGAAASSLADPEVKAIVERLQREVFVLGADIGAPASDTGASQSVPRVTAAMTARLEAEIDRFSAEAGQLTSFILPGGSCAGALIHQARSVCRRAERSLTALAQSVPIDRDVTAFVNRLSDHLFELARAVNARAGVSEQKWLGRAEPTNSRTSDAEQ